LAQFFGGQAQSWLNLQTQYDLRVAEIDKAALIAREIEPLAA
jgi:plasmid maintenance system antidote protein VapI